MSDAIPGIGCQFKFGDGASAEVFTALAEVNSITKSGMSRALINTTSLDSTGGYEEFMGGVRNGGQYVLNMNWTRDNYIILLAEYEDDDSRNAQVSFVDDGATTEDVAVVLIELGYGIPFDDKVTLDVTLQATGAPTVSS